MKTPAHEYKDPGLRKPLKGHLAIPILLLPIFPIAALDDIVSLPLMMFYMLGPVLSIAKRPPECEACGACIDPAHV